MRAALSVSYDGGASWTDAGGTAGPAVMGQSLTALPSSGSALIDTRGSVDVELLNEALWLEGRTDAALADGANLAVLGHELFQFGRVERLGPRQFRLSRLLRGRRGTEWAAAGHAVGDAFVLIEAENVAVIEPPSAMLGAKARLLALGLGDGTMGVTAQCTVADEALRPPSPVHLEAETLTNGDIAISWVRRSRGGWAWSSGIDAPLVEEDEIYELALSGGGVRRTLRLVQPHYLYGAAEQAADGLSGPLTIAVAQLGTVAPSRITKITI